MKLLLFPCLLLLSLLSVLSYIDHSFAYAQCLQGQKSLLLQIKQNLNFSSFAPVTPQLLTSWDSNTDCCSSWEGIQCDGNGYVISLDLNNKSITGVQESWTGLLELKYLRSLNLSNNRFSPSPIPSGLDQLVNLTHLNLSNTGFAGQIPIEISRMKRLVSLDLSTSTLFATNNPLKLENPDLGTLVSNLTQLRQLYLDGVNISMHGKDWPRALSSAVPSLQVLSLSNCFLSGPPDSSLSNLQSLSKLRLDGNNLSAQVPEFFGNFSNLSLLHLSSCGLLGKFPENIIQSPLLQSLDLSSNSLLQGSLPEFPQNGSLENLVLSNTEFTGNLPKSIGNLRFMSKLELQSCSFSGSIPTSMSSLSRLQYVDFSFNNFTGAVPYFVSSQNLMHIDLSHNRLNGTISSSQWSSNTKLVNLNLRNNLINGTIPSSLFTLPSLQKLDLSHNRFHGRLNDSINGSSLMLDTLDFSNNMLEGPIPPSIFSVSSLKIFTLSSNNFSGIVQLDRFQKLRNLSSLDLSGNNISINSSGINFDQFPQVGTMKLSSCNLQTFPEFLGNQSTLSYLDLSNNQIRGKIPNWIGNIGNGSLVHLNLSFNSLENPDQPFPVGQFKSLAVVDLHSNLLQGPIPILPLDVIVLDYSNNNITSIIPEKIGSFLRFAIFFSLSHNFIGGHIPSSICTAEYLQVLDLSNNSLSGSIPTCLGNISTLRVLNLRSNKLNGSMPETFPEGCSLRTLDHNANRLEGNVSTSLANCKMLEVLDLGNNHLKGYFPCWLGKLAHLRVLVLRSNKFNGPIPHPEQNNTFQMLQIIDLSSNYFTGKLPAQRFMRWKAMMTEEEAESHYKHTILKYGFLELSQLYYQDAVTVTSKGQQMELVKILTIFTSVDLSNNTFEGEIPEVIGNLISLYVLNLSGNALTGSIPSSLGSLKQLESLDLSSNKLCGQIPSSLGDLTFLSVLNLSFNQLVGTIPQGRQLQTFSENVFEGNSGLCGPPLLQICSTSNPSPEQKSTQSMLEFDWQFVVTGLGFGGGAAMVIAPLWLCDEGRKWYDKQIERLLLIMFPSTAWLYKICDDGKVDAVTEESLDDDLTDDEEEHTENTNDDMDGNSREHGRGRYCVFCTKLDINMKRPIHNPKCSCHVTPPQNSTTM